MLPTYLRNKVGHRCNTTAKRLSILTVESWARDEAMAIDVPLSSASTEFHGSTDVSKV